jgi:RimJ/RimL family protein N-acetyltransferase
VFDRQPTLCGETLLVRPLEAGDYDALRAAAADPLIWQEHPANRHEEPVFRAYFDEQLASGGGLAIVDRRTGDLIGSSRYHGYDEERSEVEIGWTFLDRRYWGGETNRELKRLMLDHAFGAVDTVLFAVNQQNRRSQRAVEKLGAALVQDGPDTPERPGRIYALTRRPA